MFGDISRVTVHLILWYNVGPLYKYYQCYVSSVRLILLIRELHIYTVKLGYSNIGFCDTLSIASDIQWYKLIPHKATVFIPCLVRHAQMHQPRV
jgi:hypothetical protein